MNGVIAEQREYGLLWPLALMLPLLAVVLLAPVAALSALTLAAIALLGFRRPVATAALVLILIPIVDQAVPDSQAIEVFGALRVTPAVVLKAMMAAVVGVYLVRNRIVPYRDHVLRPLIVWLGYTLGTCFTFHDRALAFSMWLRLAYWGAYFVFFFAVAERNPKDVLVLWRAGLIAVSLFVASVFSSKVMGVGGNYYGVGESYGFYPDPWNMAMTLPGGLVLALVYPDLFGERRTWVRSGCWSLAALVVFASFMTFTRTSLIACFVTGLLFAFLLKRVVNSKAAKRVFVFAVVAVVVAAMLIVTNVNSTKSGNQVSARWSEIDKGSIGSGRLEVFYAAWTKFSTASMVRKVMGHGIGAGPEAAEEFMGVYVYLHDDLLEMLVCCGITGIVLYCWFFSRAYRLCLAGLRRKEMFALAAVIALAAYNVTSISYMRIYAVTPNTYFALVAGTALGALQGRLNLTTTQESGGESA